MTIVDLDDFFDDAVSDGAYVVDALERLYSQTGERFRVTLFTIPSRCSKKFIQAFAQHPWIDIVPHGMHHASNYECAHWTADQMHACLDHCEALGFRTKGFKAPGWQISNGCYDALLNRGYWVADQPYNNHRRPPELPCYLLDSNDKIHGHIGHLGGRNLNELSLIAWRILERRKDDFGFVRDHLCRHTTSSSLTTV